MPYTVTDQIFQQSSQQRTIYQNLCMFRGIALVERDFTLLSQGAVVQLSYQFTEKWPGGEAFFAQRLRTVFQFAGQVQIINEGAEFFTLSTDACGFLTCGIRQRSVLFQLFAPAQDQGQRGADVVADACDPLGTGVVPSCQHLIFLLQMGAGPV